MDYSWYKQVLLSNSFGAVELVVHGHRGAHSVKGGAEQDHRVAVNSRVVGLDRAAEGVVHHATASHHNPLSRCRADNE